MSNRQSRARNRELRYKILDQKKNEKKKLFYKLKNWLKKKRKPENSYLPSIK
ncbi:hypothetical protein [Candidatus Regiella insecticola]|uniref:Uncharacterized protein n=1 Tax=Candidatus Regiella insecticola TaxID=138073 RepID=A0A6L2ZKH3_9ENTR|nr:hypothetical protein [Candidatus Regiella insecticola]GFN45337.1 hypothetical protein RINTU1_04380 [Candidatus Regiella insecticola]